MPLNIPTPQPGVDPARNMMPPLTSPSHPMAQRVATPQRQMPDLQPYTGADQIQQQLAGYGQPPRFVDYGVGSASAPWAASPPPQPQPQQQPPLGQQLQQMIGGIFGRQPQRQVQQTDPGAGYGQSPSNPMTQQQPQPQVQRPMPDLQPYTGWDQIQQQIAGYGAPPRYVDYGVGSASAPWAAGPGD